MKKLITILSTLALIFTLSGCGGGGGTAPDYQKELAVATIKNYDVNNPSTTPKVSDYAHAGIENVQQSNLDIVNAYVAYYHKRNPNASIEDLLKDLSAALSEDATLGDDDGDGIPKDFDDYPNNAKPTTSSRTVQTDGNTAIEIAIYGEDKDGDPLKYKIISTPNHGTLSEDSPLIYTPEDGYAGTDSFDFQVCDAEQCSETATITIQIRELISIDASGDYTVQSLGKGISKRATVELGSQPKDVFVLLSNYSTAFPDSDTKITDTKKISGPRAKKTAMHHNASLKDKLLPPPHSVRTFTQHLKKYNAPVTTTSKRKSVKVVKRESITEGTTETFYFEQSKSDGSTTATLRKSITSVSTNHGDKSLYIWVSNDSFDSGSGCSKNKCVTQDMVDIFADTFLKTGSDNDVYDWVTTIYGEEWGSDAVTENSNHIDADDAIHILLTDIDGDNSENGGTIGYFYGKDNYKKSVIEGSNERIMFYADAVMFANEAGGDGAGWDITDPWPMEMLSTLAHEFQHMIHFYQKTVMRAGSNRTKAWIDEMMAETTEDVVATKLLHQGPRAVEYTDGSAGAAGITEGRYPLFNQYNTLSLTSWDRSEDTGDYSKVSAFGTFLIRNYGGVKLLHDMMHNSYTDKRAIMYAIHKADNGEGKTFDNLLREWGIAVLMSSIESPTDVPTYNTGDFTIDSYSGIDYKLGSINFFNYDPEPTTHDHIGTIPNQGNFYYKVGGKITGTVDINLNLNSDTEATLIVRDPLE